MQGNAAIILQVQDLFVKSIIASIWSFIKAIWPTWWTYIIVAIILIIIGMVWQIVLFRSGSDKKLPTWFNVLVGSIFYWFFFYLVVTILYFIFGARVIDGIWFAVIWYPVYRFNRLFLIWVGFWRY